MKSVPVPPTATDSSLSAGPYAPPAAGGPTTPADADAGHDARARRLPVVEIPGGERIQLEERAARIDEPVDALARRQLPARAVPLDRSVAAAARDLLRPLAQLRDESRHLLGAREGRHAGSLISGHDPRPPRPRRLLRRRGGARESRAPVEAARRGRRPA